MNPPTTLTERAGVSTSEESFDSVPAAKLDTVLPPSALRAIVLRGLLSDRKTLPPALFYDERGAELFERICDQPEYYPTRTELGILERHAAALAELAGEQVALIEYGSGAGIKVRMLLDQLQNASAYVPVDVSAAQLEVVSEQLARQYPSLTVAPVAADYTMPFALPPLPESARRVAFFPGSTIGNFHPIEAAAFVRRVRQTVGQSGALILGVDRHKDAGVLHRAYNDRAGVTAEFNLNLLMRLNRELGANFNLSKFRHLAFYNETDRRIEMHLESRCRQDVVIDEQIIRFDAGETIHTECSYKYDTEHLYALAEEGGFRVDALFSDERDYFFEAWLVPL